MPTDRPTRAHVQYHCVASHVRYQIKSWRTVMLPGTLAARIYGVCDDTVPLPVSLGGMEAVYCNKSLAKVVDMGLLVAMLLVVTIIICCRYSTGRYAYVSSCVMKAALYDLL